MLRNHHVVTIFSVLAIIALVVSVGMPVGSGRNQTIDGLTILLVGWLGIGAIQFGWFANLLILWIAIRGIANAPITLRSFLILLALAANAIGWNKIYNDLGGVTITVWHTGYYIWWTGIGCVITASVSDFIIRKSYRRWVRVRETG